MQEKISIFIQSNLLLIKKILLAFAYLSLIGLFFLSFQELAGKIAFWILCIILVVSPLSRIFKGSLAGKIMLLRRELGITMGMFAIVHWLLFVRGNWGSLDLYLSPPDTWLIAGFIALILTLILTITSNTYSVKLLGKKWKILHKSVYFLGLFVIIHVVALKGLELEFIIPAAIYGIIALVDIYQRRFAKQ